MSCTFHRDRRIPQSGLLYLQARLDACGLGFEPCPRRLRFQGFLKKGFAMSGREDFRVQVSGRFRLTKGIIPPRLRKPQKLLQALIAFGGIEVSAGVLIDALWPDSEGARSCVIDCCARSEMRPASANRRAVGRMPRPCIDPESNSTRSTRACIGA